MAELRARRLPGLLLATTLLLSGAEARADEPAAGATVEPAVEPAVEPSSAPVLEPAPPETGELESSSTGEHKLRVVFRDKNPHLIGAQWVQDTWDLNLDLLFGGVFRDDNPFAFMVRVRHGALFIREPWFLHLGITAQVGMELPAAFGVQAELMHLAAGTWGELGLHVDTQGRVGGQIAAGYTWVGLELQARAGRRPGEADVSLLGIVRVPLRFFFFAGQGY